MRKWWIVIALGVVAVSCGEVADAPGVSETVPNDSAGAACRDFVEQTRSLPDESDHARYQATLKDAIRPVIHLAVDRGVLSDEDQNQALALERIFAGDARGDDLWAIEDLGRILSADGVEGCDELWHNLGPMPPEPPMQWDEPPAVEIDSEFETGTADHACDVFIETINAMLESRRPEGAEYGPSMADAAETLIGELKALDITEASDELSLVADLWREYRYERAGEESMRPLETASEELADVGSGRCGELFAAIIPGYGEPPAPYIPPDPITLDVIAVGEFDPGMACGRAHMASMHDVPSTEPFDDDAQQAFEALREAEEAGKWFTSTFQYGIFSRTDDELVLLGSAADGSLSSAAFRRVDGAWDPSGWGTCEWRPAGWKRIAWQVHPDYTIDPDSDSIDLLAADWCGVVTNKNHEIVVAAVYGEGSLSFELWEGHAHPPGPDGELVAETLECAIGLQLHLSVALPEPIGDRAIQGEYASLDMP
ncbi:MAG: hypothetical protein ABFS21_09725 [Actinomycetota bacterium]